MAIPTFDQFIDPLLRFLADKREPVQTKEVYAALAERVGLSPDDRSELLPSRVQPVYQNRIGWAHDRLKRAGYSESPRRGYWMLTPKGRELAESNSKLAADVIERIARVPIDSRLRVEDEEEDVPGTIESPQERIDTGVQALRTSVIQDIL